MEERELVQKILRGDEKAKTQFFVTYRERLYRNCVYLLGYQDPEAEDVVQETFITAFEKLPSSSFGRVSSTWLTQICIYKCHNRYRQRAKLVAQEQVDLDILLQPAARQREELKDEGKQKQFKLGIIDKCLEKIGKECREIIELREKQERSYVEIGKVMRIPLGTVMSRLSRCKRALKLLVEQFLKEG